MKTINTRFYNGCKITVLVMAIAITIMYTLFHSIDAFPAGNPNQVLTLDVYLQQVITKNNAILGANKNITAIELKSKESSLLFATNIFASTQLLNDEKPTVSPAAQGTKTFYDTYTLGLSKQLEMGLQGKLYYNLNYTSISGANKLYLPQPTFYDAKTVLELNYPLLRNFSAQESKSARALALSQSRAGSYTERYKVKMMLSEAEMTYWRLILARETVIIQRDTLNRAEKIYDWNHKRFKRELADQSDLLQAEAAVKARRIELQLAIDEETSAARSFNTIRGVGSDLVTEELLRLDGHEDNGNIHHGRYEIELENIPAPRFIVTSDLRDDVRAAQEQVQAVNAGANIGIEKNRPTLDLFANIALNGNDPSISSTVGKSFGSKNPTTGIGVKFNVPFEFETLRDVKSGYALEKVAAELNFKKKLFDQEREWVELEQKLAEAKKRLNLTIILESVQKQKFNTERERLQKGRTTTFQVLTFEQDYSTAKLAHIRGKAEILKILAQMKTFLGSEG